MLPLVAITQRVDLVPHDSGETERRDALDQAWPRFLHAAGFSPLPLPNRVEATLALLTALPVAGVVLSGGNDLVAYGGDAPERDATESALLGAARARGLPVIGVCRGMQVIQNAFGVRLDRIDGHVGRWQRIRSPRGERLVNSFHRLGTQDSVPELAPWARSDDGVVKAVRHRSERLIGIMWHPERAGPFDPDDLALFRRCFGSREGMAA